MLAAAFNALENVTSFDLDEEVVARHGGDEHLVHFILKDLGDSLLFQVGCFALLLYLVQVFLPTLLQCNHLPHSEALVLANAHAPIAELGHAVYLLSRLEHQCLVLQLQSEIKRINLKQEHVPIHEGKPEQSVLHAEDGRDGVLHVALELDHAFVEHVVPDHEQSLGVACEQQPVHLQHGVDHFEGVVEERLLDLEALVLEEHRAVVWPAGGHDQAVRQLSSAVQTLVLWHMLELDNLVVAFNLGVVGLELIGHFLVQSDGFLLKLLIGSTGAFLQLASLLLFLGGRACPCGKRIRPCYRPDIVVGVVDEAVGAEGLVAVEHALSLYLLLQLSRNLVLVQPYQVIAMLVHDDDVVETVFTLLVSSVELSTDAGVHQLPLDFLRFHGQGDLVLHHVPQQLAYFEQFH